MDNVIAKRTEFGKIDKRLNIDVVPKSAVAAEYDEQIAHAERELKAALEELNKQRTTALERELKGEITAEQRVRGLQRYEDAVTIAQREVLRLKEAKGRGVRAAKESEISLFGLSGTKASNFQHFLFDVPSHFFAMVNIKQKPVWANCEHLYRKRSRKDSDIEFQSPQEICAAIQYVLKNPEGLFTSSQAERQGIYAKQNGVYALALEIREKQGKYQVITIWKATYTKFAQRIRRYNRVIANAPSPGDIPTSLDGAPSGRLGVPSDTHSIAASTSKNTTSSLEHQGLSEVSVTEINAQVLARWNNSSLTAEQREQTRRAAVLLNISEKDLYKNTKQLLEAKAVALNAQIRQQSDTMHRLWGNRKGAWGRTTEADNKRERKIQILRFQLAEIKNTIEKLQPGESISARKIATLLSDSDDSALSLQENTLENAFSSREHQGLSETIVIAQRQFAHLSAKEARKAAKEYARKHLQGKTILNEHTGWEIIVTGRGIDHALRTNRSYKAQEQSEAIIVLAEVLRQAIKGETEAFRYNAKSDIVAVHKFYAALTIEQTPYTIKIIVKEKSDGRRFYDFSLLEEIKKSCQHTRIGDTLTSIPYPPSDRIYNKNTTSSLEHQGLSDIAVTEVKAQLLIRWNNVYVGEDKWEFIQRAALLLRMPLFVNDGTDRFIIYSATQELFAAIQNILPHARFNVTQNTIHANANPQNYAKCKTITERYALVGAKALQRKAYVKKCVAQKPTVTATIVGNDVHVIFSAAPDIKTITNLRNYKFIKGYGYEQPNSGEMWKARFQPYHREVLRSLFGVTLLKKQ